MRAREHVADRRYVYVPGSLPRDAIGRVWTDLRPHETVVAQGEQDALPPVSLERVRHRVQAGLPALALACSPAPHKGTPPLGLTGRPFRPRGESVITRGP